MSKMSIFFAFAGAIGAAPNGWPQSSAVPLALTPPAFSSVAVSDSEWPPEADPVTIGADPTNLDLLMGSIQIPIGNQAPDFFRDWMRHKNNNGTSGQYPMWLSIGDVRGPDDGEQHVLMYMAETLLVAFEMDLTVVNGQPTAGSLTPMWVWKSVKAPLDPPEGNTLGPNPPFGHRRNVLIWDFDGDGSNEVAFVDKNPQDTDQDTVFIVRHPADELAPSPWGFSVPAPDVLAQHASTGDRLGICRVSDDPTPRDFWAFSDEGSNFQVFELDYDAMTDTYSVVVLGDVDRNTHMAARVHEFNCADVDGDGFDEFMHDGVVDFVDADVNGLAVPTNSLEPKSGVQIWRSGYDGISENHMDLIMAADFDPARPGLEIHALPSIPSFYDPITGQLHEGFDLYYDKDGSVLLENFSAPIIQLQTAAIGNWTDTSAGLESIYLSKDPVSDATGELPRVGTYAQDAQQTPLVLDGAMFHQVELDPMPGLRAGGPADVYGAIDWDGDRTTDEILCDSFKTLIVWRMGQKGDWGAVYPSWLPTQQDLMSPWTELGHTLEWYYYQEDPSWEFNNGGPGRFTHYYEKLGEAGLGGLSFVTAHDVVGDYREEILVPSNAGLFIFFNADALPNPWLHLTPTASREYQQFRMERLPSPLVYADLPTLDRVELSPPTVGIPAPGSTQLAATAVYSDGTQIDVTNDVVWVSDLPTTVNVAAGLVFSTGSEGAARITATLGNRESEPAYVYASSSDVPNVLMAGYGDSYLDRPSPPNPIATYEPLLIQARVAQRDNAALRVLVYHADGVTPLTPPNSSVPVKLRDTGNPSHGDAVAGDGIYSALYNNAALRLSPGDQLLQIKANVVGSPAVVSETWPYLVVGPGPADNVDVTGQFNNDAQGEAFTPKIAMAGLRGIDPNDLDIAWIEADVIEPADPDTSIVAVKAVLPDGTVVDMIDRGNGNWAGLGPIAGIADDTYVFHVYAIAQDSQANRFESDYWPRVRVH